MCICSGAVYHRSSWNGGPRLCRADSSSAIYLATVARGIFAWPASAYDLVVHALLVLDNISPIYYHNLTIIINAVVIIQQPAFHIACR